MEYKQIQELIKAINKSNISELSIEEGDFKITIKQAQSISETQFVAVQAPAMPAMQLQQAAPQPMAIPAAPAAAPASPAAEKPAAAASENQVVIKAPIIGTFYRRPSKDKDVYVNVGDTIQKGDTLCIIEAMKIFNEIESEYSGKIVKVLVEDATPVEYDQPLFLVELA